MRADVMTWVQRVVGVVFLVGVLVLTALVTIQIRQVTGVPPLPVFVGILGLVGLILLAGACLALISIAVSARQGAESLRRLAAAQSGGTSAVSTKLPAARPFSVPPLQEVATADVSSAATTMSGRPTRPSGRNLVAER